MLIEDIQPKQGKINIKGKIIDISEIREFDKYGNKGRVANATLQDESGKITLTLWNSDIDKVKVGDAITIENGYCSEFQGEKQLTAGRYGTLKVVDQ